ncbi:MAG: hypothetical protein IKU35_06395 [Bacteroidaceae bacterium]|nr:hypothetical protein [Bacteroidaceae bacterium]
MALSEESNGIGATMLVSPTGGYNNGGFGGFGGDGWWLILLFLLCGGWGNNGGGFGGGANSLYPWLNQTDTINGGFRDQLLNSNITAINGGIAGLTGAVTNGFAQAEIAANSRQMADMNQNFALQSSLQDCCCANRLATAQTQNLVQSEGAATRAAIQNQTQAILDKLCEQEIEQLRAQNVSLQNQVNMLNLSASQTAQTAQLIADNTAQTQYIVNRVAPYPIPAYTVANPVTPATA